jgi:O-antigen ligase
MTPASYFERQSTILEGAEADKSTRRRTDYLVVGLRSFLKHPILGTGTLTFDKTWVRSEQTLKYDFVERPAHNTYLEVLVGSGAIGLGLFLMLLLQSFANFSQAKKALIALDQEALASLAGMYRLSLVAVLIYFLFKSGLDHKMFLLILPLSQISLNIANDVQDERPGP